MTTHLNPDCGSADILSPHVNFKWSEDCGDWPGGRTHSQVVLLHDKIYVSVTSRRPREIDEYRELHCSTDLSSWTTLTIPSIMNFSLGTYQSRLVLVGGKMNLYCKVVGDVWASEDGRKWQRSESLPPLPTPCQWPAVINTGSPEYLIVAGGYANIGYYGALDTVFVLSEGQWFLVGHLPVSYGILRFSTIHNGNLYLLAMESRTSQCFSYYSKVHSLITACEFMRSGTRIDGHNISWRKLNMDRLTVLPVSFGTQLVGVRIYNRTIRTHSEIFAYHPFNESWVHVGNLPINERPVCAFVHTTGELVVLCGRGRGQFKVVKASLQVSPYDPDSHFSMSALSKLEVAEIEVVTSLSRSYPQLVVAIGISDAPKDNLKFLIHCWLSGQTARAATWRSLHEVLRDLGLKELSQQIENCLSGIESLKEKSTSVIMSALLQQRSLELSQLYGRLPSYVPPTVKRYIIHRYTTITHQVRRPVSPGLELECPIVLPFPTPIAPKPLPKPRPPAPLPRPNRRRPVVALQATPPQLIPMDPQAAPPLLPRLLPLNPKDPHVKPPNPPRSVGPQGMLPPVGLQAAPPLPPRPVNPSAISPLLPTNSKQ